MIKDKRRKAPCNWDTDEDLARLYNDLHTYYLECRDLDLAARFSQRQRRQVPRSRRFLSSIACEERCNKPHWLKKYINYSNVIIIVSLLTIAYLIFVIASLLLESRGKVESRKVWKLPSSSRTVPDMTEFMTWGRDGSGVNVVVSEQHQKEILKKSPQSERPTNNIFDISNLSAQIVEEIKDGYHFHQLNEFISNRISLRRSLPDMRDSQCVRQEKEGMEQHSLPDAAVIIAFREEPRSVLLRAIFSVLDRSPSSHLKEVILIDRGSAVEDLGHPNLENYLSAVSVKVKIYRSRRNLTYSEALNVGLVKATAKAAVVLSPRSECTKGWLPPLLLHLAKSPYSIAVPVVDNIDGDTFQYKKTPRSEITLSTFTWELTIQRMKLTAIYSTIHHILESPLIPILNPVIGDGVFAAERELLLNTGGFTGSLTGESTSLIELSLRCWLCGRKIELVSCSRVGLVSLSTEQDAEDNPTERGEVANWWLGDLQDIVHERLGTPVEDLIKYHPVNNDGLADHNHPRRQLTCRNIRWLLQQLEPGKLLNKEQVLGSGHLRQDHNLTLHVNHEKHVLLRQNVTQRQRRHLDHLSLLALRNNTVRVQKPEFWYLTSTGQLRNGDGWCLYHKEEIVREETVEEPHLGQDTIHFRSFLDSDDSVHTKSGVLGSDPRDVFSKDGYSVEESQKQQQSGKDKEEGDQLRWETESKHQKVTNVTKRQVSRTLVVKECYEIYPQGQWTWTKERWLRHVPSELCLESTRLRQGTHTLHLKECDVTKRSQVWRFSHRDPEDAMRPVYSYLGV